MAFALVGSFGTLAAAAGSPVSPAFAQATTAGNLLIGWVAGDGTNLAVSGTGWVEAIKQAQSAAIYYKPNCGAGETAPTFTQTAPSRMVAVLAEFSGGDISTQPDKTGGTSGGAGTTPVSATTSAADTEVAELVAVAMSTLLTKAGTHTSSHTLNNGATASGNANDDATSAILHGRFAYGITTGNSAADSTSMASNSMNLSTITGAIASFRLAATVAVPRNSAVNFQDPGVLMEKRNWLWLPRRPKLWLPSPALHKIS